MSEAKSETKEKFKKSSPKKIVAIIAACLAIIYIGFSVFYMNHFYLGTEVNGMDLSGKTVEQAENMVGEVSDKYKLTLKDKRGKEFSVSAKQIDMDVSNDGGKVHDIKDSQNAFAWPIALFQEKTYDLDIVKFDEAKLKKIYDGFELFKKEYVIEPKSAYPEYSRKTNEFVARPEIYGNKLKKDELYKGIVNSIKTGKSNIDLDAEGYYEEPKNLQDNENLNKAIEELNEKVKMKITYDFEDRKEVVGGYEIAQMLKCDTDGDYKVEVDRDRMIEFIRGVSREYSTYGDARKFKTASGKEITIFGGAYGWLIDKEKEADELTKVIEKGKNVTREPVYSQTALHRTKDDIGNTYVEISIGGQYLWYFREGKLVTSFPVVTGNTSKGHGTPTGIYPLNYKERDTYLNGRNYSSHVNYWMPFNGNIGLHDATWRGSFGGSIYKSSGSHGCVNAPIYGAATVYETIEKGTPIILY